MCLNLKKILKMGVDLIFYQKQSGKYKKFHASLEIISIKQYVWKSHKITCYMKIVYISIFIFWGVGAVEIFIKTIRGCLNFIG